MYLPRYATTSPPLLTHLPCCLAGWNLLVAGQIRSPVVPLTPLAPRCADLIPVGRKVVRGALRLVVFA